MKDRIEKEVRSIESDHAVSIIYACESGSRAWGFPSRDSDYDVRFIYVHNLDWYLSIFDRRDVIELPISDDLDLNGWDIKKSLQLLKKSNSALLEWLSSPIVYRENNKLLEPFKALAKKAFLPESSCHHYLSLAKGSFQKISKSETAKRKTYLYTLRPIFCYQWIIKYLSQPPMRIDELLKKFLPSGELRREIDTIIEQKKDSRESDVIQRSKLLDDYIHEQLNELQPNIPKNKRKIKTIEFDKVFKSIIENTSCKQP